jgi:hypothetical protein
MSETNEGRALPDAPGVWTRFDDYELLVRKLWSDRLEYSGWRGSDQVRGRVDDSNLPTGNWQPATPPAELAALQPCAGCGLREDHKACPAHGTPAYMNPDDPAWGRVHGIIALKTAAITKATNCWGCGKELMAENCWMDDGCPCNTPRGVNDGNQLISDWRREREQKASHELAALRAEVQRVKAAATEEAAERFASTLANINDTCRARGFNAGPSGRSTEDRVIGMAQAVDDLRAALTTAIELAASHAAEMVAMHGELSEANGLAKLADGALVACHRMFKGGSDHVREVAERETAKYIEATKPLPYGGGPTADPQKPGHPRGCA